MADRGVKGAAAAPPRGGAGNPCEAAAKAAQKTTGKSSVEAVADRAELAFMFSGAHVAYEQLVK